MSLKATSPDPQSARQALLSRRAELTQRVRRIDADLQHAAGPLSADSEEQAAETTNDEVLSAIGATAAAEVTAIDAALARIASGTYGRCVQCHAPIEPERLAALPSAAACSHCAGRQGQG